MAILNYFKFNVFQTGTACFPIFVASNDTLSQIKSAGWLNAAVTQGLVVNSSDVVTVNYSGLLGVFTPSIDANGIITLISSDSADVIKLPVTAGNFAIFFDDNQVEDGGTPGQAAFKSVSDNTKASVPSINATPTQIGGVVTFVDTLGTVGSDPSSFRARTQTGITGGAASFTVTDVRISEGSVINATFRSQTNPASVLTALASNGSFLVTCSADPGASELMYQAAVSQ